MAACENSVCFIKIGPSLEIQPLSIFNLRMAAEYIGLFSTFGYLQSYDSVLDDYPDKLQAACSSGDPATLTKCSYCSETGDSAFRSSRIS